MSFLRGPYSPGHNPAPQLNSPTSTNGPTTSGAALAPGGRSRGDGAVSSLLGHAGQALGAVAAPSSNPASPSSSSHPSATFGHQQQFYYRQLEEQVHPASSPATSTTDSFLRLPPGSATGSGSGSGTGTGIPGIGQNKKSSSSSSSSNSNSNVVAGAAPSPPYSRPHSHYLHHLHHNNNPPPPSSVSTAKLHSPPAAASYRAAAYSSLGHGPPPRASYPQQSRALDTPDALVPGLRQLISSGSGSGADPGSAPASTADPRPMFNLPSIPTSNDDFSSIPYLNSSVPGSAAAPRDAMSQQPQQPQQFSGPPRRGTGYGEEQQQHHLQGSSQYSQHGQMSPRDYSTPSAGPHIKLDQPSSNPASYQGTPAVPSVLQPGGPLARPSAVGAITAPTLPTMQGSMSQQSDYQTPGKPSLNLSHGYSRSSPASAYDAPNPAFSPYTPTTPSGAGSSQFMSPSDRAYNAPGSQRNISHTPLGLADIRPRADSSLSDGMPSGLDFAMQNPPPGTSNYMAPWATYAFDWCKWTPQSNSAGKVAIGSYLEDGHNFIQILDTQIVPTPSDVYNNHGGSKWTMELTKIAEATHSYPVTRLLWEPPSSTKQSTDLLATSGDHLRLWSLPSETPSTPGNSITGRNRDVATTKLTPLALLSNSKTPDHTAPLTSLDWNTVSPSLIITSSIDTTCTIWDIPSLTAKTQLIAHDKEVYDVRFCANSVDVFVSCGQDGSVRMFDLRSLEHSTIIYEPTGKEDRVDPNGGKISPTLAQQTMSHPPPLLRLATSPHDTQLLATFAQDSNIIRILDTRQPGQALLELRGHGGAVNCVEWSPTRRGQLASGADDCQVLIWDLMNQPQSNGSSQSDNVRSPAASWQCEYEVGNLGWVPRLPNDEAADWLGVSAGRGIWGVRL